MTLSDAIRNYSISLSWLAGQLGVTPQAVHKFQANGWPVGREAQAVEILKAVGVNLCSLSCKNLKKSKEHSI